MINASIIGATGYTGVELIRLLHKHPHVTLKHIVSDSAHSQELVAIFPHLFGLENKLLIKLDLEKIASESNIVFLALPHTLSAQLIKPLLSYNKILKIIDLSADLRLKDGEIYKKWYQHETVDNELLQQATYGLAELGKTIKNCQLIANPGCYATATLLALAPIVQTKLVDLKTNTIIVDAKSGVSGAGRSLSLDTHYCEVTNNFSAYQVGGKHRHIAEITQELQLLTKQKISLQFTPHLVPMTRGLMTTCYVKLVNNVELTDIVNIYLDFYQQHHFVKINTQNNRPGTKTVLETNYCQISLFIDSDTGYLVIVSVIDNLGKGACGQAVQNMNLMYGLPEITGLADISPYP